MSGIRHRPDALKCHIVSPQKISLNHLFYQDKTKYSLKVLQNDVAIKVRRQLTLCIHLVARPIGSVLFGGAFRAICTRGFYEVLTSTTRFAWFAILLLSAVPLTSHAQNAANDPMGLQDIWQFRGGLPSISFSRCG